MAKIKLTKPAVDAARPQAPAVELRDMLVPGTPVQGYPSRPQGVAGGRVDYRSSKIRGGYGQPGD